MYRPVLDAVGGSLLLTAILAMLPLLTLFVLLGALKVTAWKAALVGLAISLGVAIFAYGMPAGKALLATTQGAAFGFFPILFIVINAIWIYNMTVVTGHFDVLRRSFAKISDDQRIQGVIVAFCFGGLLEALAGFGTPVAISSVMLIALGFKPIKAATVALVANTAPVAYGALAVPITTLASVTGLPEQELSSIVGRQTPLLALFVPIVLVLLIDGAKGVKQTLPATLTCGISFAIAQFVCSNFISIQLTDIVASLTAALSIVLLLRVWHPALPYVPESDEVVAQAGTRSASRATASVGAGAHDDGDHPIGQGTGTVAELAARDANIHDSSSDVAKAYAPYVIIIAVFSLATLIPFIKSALDSVTVVFQWPGMEGLLTASGEESTLPNFKLNWLSSGGTLLILAGLITIPFIGISPAKALKAMGGTYVQLKFAIVTVMAVLGLAYVMNSSGQTGTLGLWMSGAGAAFALLSPILGWIGVAVTGSDTSSNALFGALQVSAANQAGLQPSLMAAGNTSGGVMGKMVSPQNLAIAAAAVGMSGKEGEIFRKVIGWSLGFLLFMMLLVFAQSTVLSWMVQI